MTDKAEDCGSTTRRILVLSSPFPSSVQPTHGVFVKERVRAIAELPGCDVRVVSPIPYFPPIKWFKRWYVWSQFPREEVFQGLPILRPRYFLPPKVGGYLASELMYGATRRAVERIRRDFDFDVIDAHWVYPNGVVATRLGQHYRKPVVVTGRGADIMEYPKLPFIGPRIRQALAQGPSCVALSREIARMFESEGTRRDAISLIPNGVDIDKFRPIPQHEAQSRLNLPVDRPLVLAVGNLQELKGFHLLVDAIPRIRERFPDVLLVIVGGALSCGKDYTGVIEDRIRANDAHHNVRLAGRCPHEQLAKWYSAADAFVLISSREGCPNVVLESLACGTPCVATNVGSIPDELEDPRLGIILPERSAEAAAAGIIDALSRQWDRAHIRRSIQTRTWQSVAEKVVGVFDEAMERHCGKVEQ